MNKPTTDFKMSINTDLSLGLFFTSVFFCQSKSSLYVFPNQTDKALPSKQKGGIRSKTIKHDR